MGLKLALIGSINDNIIDTTSMSLELILLLHRYYPEVLPGRYDLEITEKDLDIPRAAAVLEQIARKRACLLKGGEPDIDRAAGLFIDDFRSTKLGNITLEFPPKGKAESEKDKTEPERDKTKPQEDKIEMQRDKME